jgi:KDO2-lipid IV(A) lauroyltransferase
MTTPHRIARSLLRAVAYLPLPVLHAAGWALGNLLWLPPSKRKRVALANVRACFPGLSRRRQRRLARRSLVNELKTYLELMRFWLGPASAIPRMVREVVGEELRDAAMARGRGLLLLTPHLSNPEVSGFYHSQARGDIHGVYKPQKGLLDGLALESRSRFGAELVPTDGQPVGPRVKAWLEHNQAVMTLPDQDPPPGRGVFAPFFGIAAHTPRLVSRMVRETGCAVLFFYTERLPRSRGFRVHYRAADEAVGDPDPERAAAALNRGLEELIRCYPEQYWWSYARFRRRPEGEPPFYKLRYRD